MSASQQRLPFQISTISTVCTGFENLKLEELSFFVIPNFALTKRGPSLNTREPTKLARDDGYQETISGATSLRSSKNKWKVNPSGVKPELHCIFRGHKVTKDRRGIVIVAPTNNSYSTATCRQLSTCGSILAEIAVSWITVHTRTCGSCKTAFQRGKTDITQSFQHCVNRHAILRSIPPATFE